MQRITTPEFQYRMDPSTTSNYYLERAGFEAKVNFRHNLKNGRNLIGRYDTPDVDIGINSSLCSRKHCVINVSSDQVSVEDLNSSNGTTINGSKIMNPKIVMLKETDLIGIIGGLNPVSELSGNHNFVVYRLCKYSSNNIQTFEIEDDDPIELSDEEEDNVICLDSDGEEAVDIKEEYDLDIQLSRNFNMEIKKELEELDEDLEALSIEMKKEPKDLHECGENVSECYDLYYSRPEENVNKEIENTEQVASMAADSVVNDDDNSNDSTDSNRTVCFPTDQEESNVKDLPEKCDNECALSDRTNLDSSKLAPRDLELKLKETVDKVIDSVEKKRKKGPEIIYAKPLAKKRKTKDDEIPPNDKLKPKCTNDSTKDRKEKLKVIASTSPKRIVPEDERQTTSAHTTPKVKFTPNNRGSFLADLTQLPVLPRDIQQKNKIKESNEITSSPEKMKPIPEKVIPTPPELEQKIWENMFSHVTHQDSVQTLNDQSTKVNMIRNPGHEAAAMENEDSGTESFTNDDEENTYESIDGLDDGVEMETEENTRTDENNDDDDDDDGDDDDDAEEDTFMYNILMSLPPETGNIHIIETVPKPDNLKSILKSSETANTNVTRPKRGVTFKEIGFQYDPRHEIISEITAYDYTKCQTVDAFCRCADTSISSFADSYENYKDYRKALVSLMMVELWKEIELEYVNSNIHSFTTVTINYQNLEKRGGGRRMIFHCQADSLYKSQSISDGHLVFVKCKHDDRDIEFLGLITSMAYSNKLANQKLAHFTMETSALTEVIPIQLLQIRPITIIRNTLNNFNAIYNLKHSPLKSLVTNPIAEENLAQKTPENLTYKTFDPLDQTQLRILNSLYRRCINLNVPNISLVDGAAGTGKTSLIVNLALQLVYGDGLPKPLKILICSKSNGSINELTKKLIKIRDSTTVNTKIQLVRFGLLENMDSNVQRVSVQHLKELELNSPQFTSYEHLVNQKSTLELKIAALNLDTNADHSRMLEFTDKQLFKVNALLERFKGVDKKKLRDSATFILNSCDIICTTMARIPLLQSYVSQVDVCIIDEATQCSEPLTLLPFQFGMPSLVLVGDSQLIPPASYSSRVKEMNYGNSMFARFQKLFLGKFGSPVYEMHLQYRIHEEILKWPNRQFYKNCLVPHINMKDDSFPIVPYKIISYAPDGVMMESDSVMQVVKVLLHHVDTQTHTIGMICANFKQNSIMRNKLRDYPFISTNTADSYMEEKDVIIIFITKEHGISHLAHQQTLNTAVTRAKKCLLICGANLMAYRNRPVWKSLLEDAYGRKCIQQFKVLTAPKVCKALSRNSLAHGRNTCALCVN